MGSSVRTPLRLRALAFALVGALVAPGPLAAAPAPDRQAVAEATDRYKRGIKLYQEGDYPASLAEFRRAYELAPAPQVLFNIARVHRQLQNYVEALRHYERYQQEAGKKTSRARLAEVRREVDELRKRVAKLEVRSKQDGVDITIDDEPAGTTPLAEPLQVNAGRHRLSATKAHHEAFRTTVEVAGAETKVVEIALVEIATPPAPAASATPAPGAPAVSATATATAAEPPPSKRRGPSWGAEGPTPLTGFIAAGALAAGAAVTGTFAFSEALQTRRRADRGPVNEEYDTQRQKAERWGLATDILAGAALITGGVSLYFYLKPRPAAAPVPKPTPTPAAWGLDVGPGGLVVRGRF